jgi:DNA polymerase-3 subunit delta
VKAKPDTLGPRLDKPAPDIRLYLLHGPDEAGAAELAQRLGRALGPEAERIEFEGSTLKAHPGALADEAASLSLFGGARYIRVNAMGEESLEAVTLLLSAERAGNPVVALAPSVKGTGKLVKLVSASPHAFECACYVPDAQAAARLATALGRDHGLRLSHEAAERLAVASGGDRAILAREIEKLALFLDAAPDQPRDAGLPALDAIGADLGEAEMFGAIAAIIGGDAASAGSEVAALEAAGNHSVPLLRMTVRRLLSLAEMRAEIDDGARAAEVVERHRVFFREKQPTLDALRRWTSPQLARAIERLRQTERATMSGASAGDVLTAHVAVAAARSVRR